MVDKEEDPVIKAWKEKRRERHQILMNNSRLSLPWHMRLPFATSVSFIAGMALGASHGSTVTGLRFRAENAHRLPSTPTGWYFYHKSKNYQKALGAVKEGFKMGAKVSLWTATFFAIEEMFDRYRHTKDFLNTTLASLSVAGAFSAWNRFPIRTAARTAKTGLAIGLVFGLAQDAVGIARGRRLGYVDFIRGRTKADPSIS